MHSVMYAIFPHSLIDHCKRVGHSLQPLDLVIAAWASMSHVVRVTFPGYNIPVSNDVGANICAARFELTDLESFAY